MEQNILETIFFIFFKVNKTSREREITQYSGLYLKFCKCKGPLYFLHKPKKYGAPKFAAHNNIKMGGI